MPSRSRDPLLGAAHTLLALFIGLLIFALVMVAIGVGAVLTVQKSEIEAKVAAAGMAPATYWGVVAGLLAIAAILYFGLRFVMELRRIIDSVDEGDPFVIQSAERLWRMGWLALAIQLIEIPLGLGAASLGRVAEVDSIQIGVSGGGLLLALTLFILARVFRKGAEMRDDLAGTI